MVEIRRTVPPSGHHWVVKVCTPHVRLAQGATLNDGGQGATIFPHTPEDHNMSDRNPMYPYLNVLSVINALLLLRHSATQD